MRGVGLSVDIPPITKHVRDYVDQPWSYSKADRMASFASFKAYHQGRDVAQLFSSTCCLQTVHAVSFYVHSQVTNRLQTFPAICFT